jgi:dienelactone hydrolase
MLNDPKSGFQAQVYVNPGPPRQIVLAFAGTQNAADAGTDAEDAISPLVNVAGSQYARAVEVARLLDAQYPGQVVMTGHSLGGDLAAVAAFATGDSAAVTFNAKGTNIQDLETMPGTPWSPDEIQSYAASHIITYGTPDNILATVQNDTPVPGAIGNYVELPPSQSASTLNPIDGHMINALKQSMDEDPRTYNAAVNQTVITGTY